jgi:hypothetical protein
LVQNALDASNDDPHFTQNDIAGWVEIASPTAALAGRGVPHEVQNARPSERAALHFAQMAGCCAIAG